MQECGSGEVKDVCHWLIHHSPAMHVEETTITYIYIYIYILLCRLWFLHVIHHSFTYMRLFRRCPFGGMTS